jgi:hypothetical protein
MVSGERLLSDQLAALPRTIWKDRSAPILLKKSGGETHRQYYVVTILVCAVMIQCIHLV